MIVKKQNRIRACAIGLLALLSVVQVGPPLYASSPGDDSEWLLPDDNEHVELSPATAALDGSSESNFVPVSGDTTFVVSGAELHDSSDEMMIYKNGKPLGQGTYWIESKKVVLGAGALVDGANRLYLVGRDKEGRTFEHEAMLWAGENTIAGIVYDDESRPLGGVIVRIAAAHAPGVGSQRITDGDGRFSFESVPRDEMLINVSADGFMPKNMQLNAKNFSEVRLRRLGAASEIQNNDFSQGVEGWGGTNLNIVPHSEEAPVNKSSSTKKLGRRMDGKSADLYDLRKLVTARDSNNDLF